MGLLHLTSVLMLVMLTYGHDLDGTPFVTPYRNTLHGTDFNDHLKGGSSSDVREACVVGSACDACDDAKPVRYSNGTASRMCCEGCGGYMRLGYSISNNPVCVCDREERIVGNCWKGSQCDVCNKSVIGFLNLIQLCCGECVASGLQFSTTYCHCLYNGPGDRRLRLDTKDSSKVSDKESSKDSGNGTNADCPVCPVCAQGDHQRLENIDTSRACAIFSANHCAVMIGLLFTLAHV